MKIFSKMTLGLLAAGFVLSGCEGTAPVQKISTQPIDVLTFPHANPAALRKKKDGSLHRYTHGLRTFEMVNDKRVEVIGASCTLVTKEFKTTVTTPVNLRMPMLNRSATPKLLIDCKTPTLKGLTAIPLRFLKAAPTTNLLAAALAAGIAKGLDRHTYGLGETQYMSVLLK